MILGVSASTEGNPWDGGVAVWGEGGGRRWPAPQSVLKKVSLSGL